MKIHPGKRADGFCDTFRYDVDDEKTRSELFLTHPYKSHKGATLSCAAPPNQRFLVKMWFSSSGVVRESLSTQCGPRGEFGDHNLDILTWFKSFIMEKSADRRAYRHLTKGF